nr:MAG TPA: cyclin [Caudoviricetes sp.]
MLEIIFSDFLLPDRIFDKYASSTFSPVSLLTI